jgi:hypothetical protein
MLNLFLHVWHSCGLSVLCMRMTCSFRWEFVSKALSHVSQTLSLTGFLLTFFVKECIDMWRRMLESCENVCPHTLHACGCCPECVLMWRCMLPFCENFESHIVQAKSCSPECTDECVDKAPAEANVLSHVAQTNDSLCVLACLPRPLPFANVLSHSEQACVPGFPQ